MEHRRPGRNLSSRSRVARRIARLPEEDSATATRDRFSDSRRRAPAEATQVGATACPKGKHGFPRHVAEAKLVEYAGSPRPPVRIYECPHCSAWHLTSEPSRG